MPALAQRTTDKLDRGLVAVPSGSGSFVSWKIFGEEYYDTGYNLYRNGIKVNSTPLRVSNFTDPQGTAGSVYSVAAVVRGVEQDRCPEVKRLTSQYIDIPVAAVTDRNGNVVTSEYIINDISLGDVDGDGVQEFIVKRNRAHGTTVILTTHDMQDIEAITRRIILIGKGKILLDGGLDELRRGGEDIDHTVAELYRSYEI